MRKVAGTTIEKSQLWFYCKEAMKYNRSTFRYIAKFAQHYPATFIDVGGNRGDFSLVGLPHKAA
jgi:hypothetical protein